MMTATRARIAHDPAGESTLIDVLYLVAARMPEHKDLVIISCCSRDVQNAVKHFVTENLCKLLSGVIRTASIDTARNWTAMLRTKSRIHWLMKTAEAVDQATVKGVIGISNIPDDLVFWLIDYGVHPSYQQLLEAARGRASGVEHWAVLMVRKGVSHDIPQGVADMLCLVQLSLEALRDTNIKDYLHLTINSSAYNSATSWILDHLLQRPKGTSSGPTLIQQQITPDLLHHLLLTAIQRHHSKAPLVVRKLLQFPAVAQLSADAVQECYLTAIRVLSCGSVQSTARDGVMSALCAPQFTQHLDSRRAAALLATAVCTSCCPIVEVLSGLEAVAGGVAAPDLYTILYDLVCGCTEAHVASSFDIFKALSKHPAAPLLSNNNMISIATAIILKHGNKSLRAQMPQWLDCTLQLKPGLLLPLAAVSELLDTAVRTHADAAAIRVLEVPAAQSLGTQAVVSLLQQGIALFCHQGDHSRKASSPWFRFLMRLVNLPAAAQINAATAEGLIKVALDLALDVLLNQLTPKLTQLDAAGLARLLLESLCCATSSLHGPTHLFVNLLRAPTVAKNHISAQQLVILLTGVIQRAAAQDDSQGVALLCGLPAASDLSAVDLHKLLHLAICGRYSSAVIVLIQLPKAELLSAAEAANLLSAAIHHSLNDVAGIVINFCKSLRHLEAPKVFELLESSMALRLNCSSRLCELLMSIPRSNSGNSSGSSGSGSGGSNGSLESPIFGIVSASRKGEDDKQGPAAVPTPIVQQSSRAEAEADAQGAIQQRQQQARQQQEQQEQQQETTGAVESTGADPYASMLDRVLDLAVQHRCLSAVRCMLEDPAAATVIDSHRVQHLLTHAVQQQAPSTVTVLSKLPAAAVVPAVALQSMLMAALKGAWVYVVGCFSKLPAVQQIPPDAALALLHQAQRGPFSQEAVGILVHALPAVGQLAGSDVFELIDYDIRLLNSSCILHLVTETTSPWVNNLVPDQACSLLKSALVNKQFDALSRLCLYVPAAKQITNANMEALLHECSMSQWFHTATTLEGGVLEAAADSLFALPGVQQLSATAVHTLLRFTLLQDDKVLAERLVKLPAVVAEARAVS